MARLPRLTLAAHPHHVIQRGNNRQPICLDSEDFQFLKDVLAQAAQRYRVAVHAFVLMDNHFHLLVKPNAIGALSHAIGWLGQFYVRAFNLRHRHCGAMARALQILSGSGDYRWSSVPTHLARARSAHHSTPALPRDGERPLRARPCLSTMAGRRHRTRRPAAPKHICQPGTRARREGLQHMVETTLGRPATCRSRGRPRQVGLR